MKQADEGEENIKSKEENPGILIEQNDSKLYVVKPKPTQMPLLDFVRNYYSPSFKNAVRHPSVRNKRLQFTTDLGQEIRPVTKRISPLR